MQLTRHFTKVFQKERKPLAHRPFQRAFDDIDKLAKAVEDVVISDVRFALLGDEPKTDSVAESAVNIEKQK